MTSAKINDRNGMCVKYRGARKKREKSRSAKNQGARERESANAKARNLRPKKERESASAKSTAKKRESASAKRKKKRVPSSGQHLDPSFFCIVKVMELFDCHLISSPVRLSLLNNKIKLLPVILPQNLFLKRT